MKKIVVVGAGGVGGFFGAKLSNAGYNVCFIVRGAHKRAIETSGIQIKSIDGDFKAFPKVSDQYVSLSDADLVILAVKSWQLNDLGSDMLPHLNKDTIILPLQNGADNTQRLQRLLPDHIVLGGLCKIVSKIESPGVINHFAYVPEIIFGTLDNSRKKDLETISTLFERSGIKHQCSATIERHIWLKFLFIASISGLGALTRSVLGVMRENVYLRDQIIATSREIILVGQALGVDLTENDLKKNMDIVDANIYKTTMSMQRDIMEGRPSELENFNGFITKQAKKLGLEAPVNEWIYHCLSPMEHEARKKSGIT